MQTLALDSTNWDLMIDANGNIAVLNDPLSQAQDAASEIKLFLGELYYDTTRGLPYFQSTLGQIPSLPLLRAQRISAALMVPGVTKAKVFFSDFIDRSLFGQVQIVNGEGNTAAANF